MRSPRSCAIVRWPGLSRSDQTIVAFRSGFGGCASERDALQGQPAAQRDDHRVYRDLLHKARIARRSIGAGGAPPTR